MGASDLAISICGISKRYIISHLAGSQDLAVPTVGVRLRRALRPTLKREEFWALKDVTFDVHQGDVVGVVGKNGAGKSTLLKILSRITEPTTGLVDVYGTVGSLLEVGTGFHPELTGRENVFLNGAILGMRRSEIEAKFDEIVEFSGVERFLDTPVKRYSSGMYVRLAFAVAAHLNPDILVIDEVLAVGDAEFQKKCLGKIQNVSASGRTVLFVSHNLTVVKSICTRAVLMVDGCVQQVGPTSEVVAAYRDAGAAVGRSISLDNVGRLGNGDAQFKTIEIEPVASSSMEDNTLGRGQDLAIRLSITAQRPVANSIVAVVIYEADGLRIIDVNSEIKNLYVTLAAGESVSIDFTLRRLMLKSGTYSIGLWLGRTITECYDHVEYAGIFEVAHDPSRARIDIFPGPYTCEFDAALEVV